MMVGRVGYMLPGVCLAIGFRGGRCITRYSVADHDFSEYQDDWVYRRESFFFTGWASCIERCPNDYPVP